MPALSTTVDTTFFEPILTEGYPDDPQAALEESLNNLLPLIGGVKRESLQSEWDLWSTKPNDELSKSLPYWDKDSLTNMQRVGFRLWRDTNIQSAIEIMGAFVVYKGWSFSVSTRQGEEYPTQRMKVLKRAHNQLVESVNLGNHRGWYFLQKESYKRFLRDGEFFRRWWVLPDGTLHVRFIEVYDVEQPASRESIINLETLPAEVLMQFDTKSQEVPGAFGVVSAIGDAATEIGYWLREDEEKDVLKRKYRFVSSARIQHAKCGVDANDPRGVPAFYDAVCSAARAGEVDEAMNELAVKQSRYAVVHKHRATNRREAIRGIADARTREMNDQVSGFDRRENETHTKNVDIEMHGMKTQARNYVEVIQQDQRAIGAVRQIPEYMITNDANTGNRSSLQTANSPFVRRVAMDQKDMWYYDQELQWNSLLSVLNWVESTALSTRRRTQINVTFPISESKDPDKDAKTVMDLRKDGAISRQEQRRRLDVNHQQMEEEIKAEGGILVSPNDIPRSVAAQTGLPGKPAQKSASPVDPARK